MKKTTRIAALLLCLLPTASLSAQEGDEVPVLPVTTDDVDADGELTLNDITQLIALYLDPSAASASAPTDIDLDGQATVNDITELIHFYLGVEGD